MLILTLTTMWRTTNSNGIVTGAVAAGLEVVFEEKIIAEDKPDPDPKMEGCIAQEEIDRGDRDREMEDADGREAGCDEMNDPIEQHTPASGMALVAHVVIQIRERVAVPGEKVLLALFQPQLVVIQPEDAERDIPE